MVIHMKNNYEVRGDVTAIYMKCPNGVILETLIETSDLELLGLSIYLVPEAH